MNAPITRSSVIVAVVGIAAALALAGCAIPQAAPRPPVPEEDSLPETPFDKAADRPPTYRTLYVMSKLYARQGKEADAESILRKLIRDNPKFVPAYCDLAEMQLRQERANEALTTLQAGLKVAPADPVLLNNLGMCHLLRRDYGAALQAFSQASSLRPDDDRYRSNTAVAVGMLGRYDESLRLFSQVLSPADAHYNLGVICESRHDNTRAAEEFRKSIDLQAREQAADAAGRKARVLRSMAANSAVQTGRPAAKPVSPNAAATAGQ